MFKKIAMIVVVIGSFTMSVWGSSTSVFLNNEKLEPATVVIENGSALVPVRAIFEKLDFQLTWDGEKNMIRANHGDFVIELKPNQKEAYVNGAKVIMQTAPRIENGVTLVPLRFVSEASGAAVLYSEAEHRISISTETLDEEVRFSDPSFKEEMQELMGKTEIKKRDLFYIINLEVTRTGIANLNGIEFCKNLKKVNLSDNRIGNIEPLKYLNHLEELDLSRNQFNSISPLIRLNKLATLNVQNNNIASYEPLIEMKSLKKLYIRNNASQDFSPLYFIQNRLEVLDINKEIIDRPDYDTPKVSIKTDFAYSVNPEVQWVPVNRMGGTTKTNETMDTLVKQESKAKQNQIQTPYELAQLLYLDRWFKYADVKTNYRGVTGDIWTIYPSGLETLRINQGGAVGLALMGQTILQNDYPETGILFILKEDGSYTLLNYVRAEKSIFTADGNGKEEYKKVSDYFTFTTAAFLEQSNMTYSDETGIESDFKAAALASNNVLCAKSLDSIVKYLAQQGPDIALVCKINDSSTESNGFAVGMDAGQVVLPEKFKNSMAVIYKKSNAVEVPKFSYINLETKFFENFKTMEPYMYQ